MHPQHKEDGRTCDGQRDKQATLPLFSLLQAAVYSIFDGDSSSLTDALFAIQTCTAHHFVYKTCSEPSVARQ